MLDKKTSLLINRQVPEFVREEHPKFISFLEAYYEFLDNTTVTKSKDLRYISDVDYSLDEFEKHFFNTFLPFIPRNSAVSKEFLIKNILPLYLAKGSEKSYKLLFRMLFDSDVNIEYPGKRVLRASDGRWVVENLLRIATDAYTEYVSDGQRTTYLLPYILNASDFEVYINNEFTTDYSFRREYKKIVFNEPFEEGTLIRIKYLNFSPDFLRNRKITGLNSGASALIERVGRRSISNLVYYEFFINTRTLVNLFENGELVKADIIVDDFEIPFFLRTFSDLERIDIIKGGSSYNVGDPVIIRGTAIRDAIAVVDRVASGLIEELNINRGGAGFQLQNFVNAVGFDPVAFSAKVQTIDSTGIRSSNTISYNVDIIEPYANVTLDSLDYGFPVAGDEDINTVIGDVLEYQVLGDLGEITSILIENSSLSTISNPTFDVNSAVLFANTTIQDLGIIGKIDIVSGGSNYQVGDNLIFINNPGAYSGQGAEAVVSNVSTTGAITQVTIINGGLSYKQTNFPTITVDTTSGSGANLRVNCIMGDGEEFLPVLQDTVAGQILSIKILDPGASYTVVPGIDLTQSGDRNAEAEAIIRDSFITLPGRWKTSDSIISTDEIRLQGQDYFIDFSYVLSTKVELSKYRTVLKSLLHPSGLVNYSKFVIQDNIDTQINVNVDSDITLTAAGFVEISNNSTVVLGTNTEFQSLNSSSVLVEGTTISIDGQIREVSEIQDDTTLEVTEEFTSNSTNTILKILV
jgi:hypothetical protein